MSRIRQTRMPSAFLEMPNRSANPLRRSIFSPAGVAIGLDHQVALRRLQRLETAIEAVEAPFAHRESVVRVDGCEPPAPRCDRGPRRSSSCT